MKKTEPKLVIIATQVTRTGMWGDKPLYKGRFVNHPKKGDQCEWHFIAIDRDDKHYIEVQEGPAKIEYEIEFK